jgi:hypothetical protein
MRPPSIAARHGGDFFVDIHPKLITPGKIATIRCHIRNPKRVVIEEIRSWTGKAKNEKVSV